MLPKLYMMSIVKCTVGVKVCHNGSERRKGRERVSSDARVPHR